MRRWPLPSSGLCLSVLLHVLPIALPLALGHATSEPSGIMPGGPGTEVAVAFGLPSATADAPALPDLLPIPILAAPPPSAPGSVVLRPDEPPVLQTAEFVVAEEPPPVAAEPSRVPPKPRSAHAAQRRQTPKPMPAPAAPSAAPDQIAAVAPAGLPDASSRAESAAPPAAAEPGAGAGASAAAKGASAPGDGGPLVLFDPAYREPPTPPAYPPRSVLLGQQGQVIVRAAIDRRGNPEEVVVWTSSGHPLLDKAALDAVKRWRFVPARRGDATVSAWVQVPVNFKLR